MKVKQVIVIRRDLKMRRGKEIAQGSHASISFLTKNMQGMNVYGELTEVEKYWINDRFTKVCVKVNSEEELLQVHEKALAAGLTSHLITDDGTTEFGGQPTATCLAIGPDLSEKIDCITGNLVLY
jgi:PTH2 family peptidyl-tRNA hydrolase